MPEFVEFDLRGFPSRDRTTSCHAPHQREACELKPPIFAAVNGHLPESYCVNQAPSIHHAQHGAAGAEPLPICKADIKSGSS